MGLLERIATSGALWGNQWYAPEKVSVNLTRGNAYATQRAAAPHVKLIYLSAASARQVFMELHVKKCAIAPIVVHVERAGPGMVRAIAQHK